MNLIQGRWGALVGTFVISAAVGCSSSSGGGPGGGGAFSTSVPAGAKLTGLTPAQAQQLCNDLDAYAARTLNTAVCKELGVEAAVLLDAFASSPPSDSELRAACTQAYDGCLNPDGGATTTTSCDPASLMSEPSTCQATVGDLTTCVDDQNRAYQQAAAAIPSCGSLTAATIASFSSSDAGADSTGVTEPQSCAKFDSTCNTMAP